MLRNSRWMLVTSPQTPAVVDDVRGKEESNLNTLLRIREFTTGTMNTSVSHYLIIAPLLLPKEY